MHSGEAGIAFGRIRLAVYAEPPALLDRILYAFREMLGPVPVPEDAACRLELVHREGRFYLYLNGKLEATEATTQEAQRRLHHAAVRALVQGHPEFLWLHAGAVAQGDRALLLAGRFGSGKSTFSTRLVARGWSYLSDDVVPIDPVTGSVRAFPLLPMVRVPESEPLPPERLHELSKQAFPLPADAIATGAADTGLIVFPRFTPEAPLQATPLTPSAGVMEALRHCLSSEWDRSAAVASISRLLARVPSYRLDYPDADAGLDALSEILAAAGFSHR